AATLAAVKTLREETLAPQLARHDGRIVKTTGDGFLIEFASAVDAVEAALAIQSVLADDPDGLALRIGINLGDVVIDDNDVFGDGVNVAARLEGIAEPGSVYVSSNIHEQVAGKIDADFADLGPQALKNIDQPVRVFALRTTGDESARAKIRQGGDAAGGPPVVAILPFTNMSSAA
ncbi:MAG: adenylate/guanylate cyclase domain-containing protein, partial [Alphaproteobacteria bacterium]